MNTPKHITIGDTLIGEGHPVYIIAEAGVNHNGDMKLAKQLVDVAKDAGVDAVKFQSFHTEHLILKDIEKAPYQHKKTSVTESQYEMLKRLEITKDAMHEIMDYCRKKEIQFISTPFDQESAEDLYSLGVDVFKVASTDTTNLLFLETLAQYKKPILLSTGMSWSFEVEKAVETIELYNKDLVIMQCTANYPIEDHEAHLRVISTYQNKFPYIIGYSDHTKGIGASPYAVSLGVKVIEKHFTLDTTLPGPDHQASLSPDELSQLVLEIRKVETYLGSSIKEPTDSEKETRKYLQKCFVTKKPLKKGDVIYKESLIAKRTGGKGISAFEVESVLGKRVKKALPYNHILTNNDFE